MIHLRRFSFHAYLLAFLAILVFTVAELSPPVLVIGSLVLGLSWWLVERANSRPLPRWLINTGVIGCSLLLFNELVLRDEKNLLLALGHFMIAILLCKVFETKGMRDYAQMLVLSLLIVVTATILAPASLMFGVALTSFLGVGMYVLLLFHLHGEARKGNGRAAQAAGGTGHGAMRLKQDVRFVTWVAAVLLGVFAAGVFAAFPRSRGNAMLAGWRLRSNEGVTGFSDTVSFDSIRRLQTSDAVAMQVQVTQNGMALPDEQYYFRGMTFDTYDPNARRWIRSRAGMVRQRDDRRPEEALEPRLYATELLPDASGQFVVIPRVNPEQPGATPRYVPQAVITQHYNILGGNQPNVLFAIAPPATVRKSGGSNRLRSLLVHSRDYMLTYRGDGGGTLEYEVDSPIGMRWTDPPPAADPGFLGWVDSEELSGPVHVPVPAAIMAKAREAAGDLAPPSGKGAKPEQFGAIAERIQDYLRRNYRYSLKPLTAPRDADPIVFFLTDEQARKQGAYCEYFASAMVMMCDALGVPARLATGYHGGEYNSVGGFYIVRQKYAHAWAEVYVPGRGWQIRDATPAAPETTASATDSWLRWFHEVYQVIDRNWLAGIAAFDNSTRQYLAELILNPLNDLRRGVGEWLADFRAGLHALVFAPSTPRSLRLVALGCVVLSLAGVVFLLRRSLRRRASAVRTAIQNLDRATQRRLAVDLAFFDELMWTLRPLGVRRAPHQTPREYVDQLVERLAGAREEARFLVAAFYELRFGGVNMTPELRQRIAGALVGVRQAVKQRGSGA